MCPRKCGDSTRLAASQLMQPERQHRLSPQAMPGHRSWGVVPASRPERWEPQRAQVQEPRAQEAMHGDRAVRLGLPALL